MDRAYPEWSLCDPGVKIEHLHAYGQKKKTNNVSVSIKDTYT